MSTSKGRVSKKDFKFLAMVAGPFKEPNADNVGPLEASEFASTKRAPRRAEKTLARRLRVEWPPATSAISEAAAVAASGASNGAKPSYFCAQGV